MDASIVYQVAKTLPKEELAKLYGMLKANLYPKLTTKPNIAYLPEFADEDALEYLFDKLNIK